MYVHVHEYTINHVYDGPYAQVSEARKSVKSSLGEQSTLTTGSKKCY